MAAGLEDALVRPVVDHLDLPGLRPPGREGVPHERGARDDGVREPDAPLLERGEHPYDRMAGTDAEPALEELRRRLEHVQHDPGAQQPRHDRGEHQRLRHRVDLDDRVAAPELANAKQQRHDGEEAQVLDQVAGEAPAPPSQ
jgi:hypothetical protein